MSICTFCNTEIVAGIRWCPICHTNVVNPVIGRLASPGKRVGAFFADLLLPGSALLLFFAIAPRGAATDAGAGIGSFLGSLLLLAYIIWAFVLFARGTTPGKKLLGMRVVKEDGRNANFFTMFIREWVGKLISGLILLLGFLWILIDRDNQGWHDKLMSTYVVELNRG